MALSYFTSSTLILDVKRRALIPTNQSTFQTNDFLAFANDEMMIGIVPSVMSVHQEYFVTTQNVALVSNQSNYPIPYRAIGGKLRDLFYQDEQGNLREMSRVAEEDIAFYNTVTLENRFIYFFVRGNDIILLPKVGESPTGNLVFVYFQRPNQLVDESRVATISAVANNTITGTITGISTANPCVITCASHGLSTGNYVTVSNSNSTPNINTTYLVTVIDANTFSIPTTVTVAGTSGDFTSAVTVLTMDTIPTGFSTGVKFDLMQALPGHRTVAFDIIPTSINTTNKTMTFNTVDIPTYYTVVVDDYVSFSGECIIPQIPDELHSVLSQRVALRCIDALGDQTGAQMAGAKLQEMELKTGYLIDSRVEGAPQKINNLRGLLRSSKVRRRGWV